MIAFRNPTPAESVAPLGPPKEETEKLADEIARLAAHLHAATYEFLVLIRAFDEKEGWGCGFRSCAAWLSWRTGIGPGPAREKVRVARALGSLPLISRSMARGELSFSKVRALTRVATQNNEANLLQVARHATAAHIERLVRAWRRVDRYQEVEVEAERHRRRYLRLYPDDDGNYVLRGRLDPEVGALVEQALEWAQTSLYRKTAGQRAMDQGTEGIPDECRGSRGPQREPAPLREAPTFGQRQADALGLVAERALSAAAGEERASSAGLREEGPPSASPAVGERVGESLSASAGVGERVGESLSASAGVGERVGESLSASAGVGERVGERTGGGQAPTLGRAERFQVVVHVGAGAPHLGQGVLEGGGIGVSAETSLRLSCDASVVGMAHDGQGRVLNVGRKRRTVPPAIRRALDHRDGGCRFPGCGCRYADAHHVQHWAAGGETSLGNLILLCRRHHRAVHEEGFGVEIEESGKEFLFRFPDGRPMPEVPKTPGVPSAPSEALKEVNRAGGINPDAWTATPLWQGEVLDLGLAIDMFRHLGRSSP